MPECPTILSDSSDNRELKFNPTDCTSKQPNLTQANLTQPNFTHFEIKKSKPNNAF